MDSLGFEPRISCLSDKRFTRLCHKFKKEKFKSIHPFSFPMQGYKLSFIFFLSLCLLISSVSASSFSSSLDDLTQIKDSSLSSEKKISLEKQYVLDNLKILKDEYNSQSIPSSLKTFVGSEKINVYLDDEEAFSVTFKKGSIETISSEALSRPTANVYVSDNVFSDYNGNTLNLQTSLLNGDIKYKSTSFFGRFKASFLQFRLR